MASASGSGRISVRRYLSALVVTNVVVVLVVGIFGIVVVVRSHRSVQYLTGTVEPAAKANSAALQSLTDAESDIIGYEISGDSTQLIQYQVAVGRFRARMVELKKLKGADAQLSLLVDDFEQVAETWITSYAEPRVEGDVGPETFDDAEFLRSRAHFAEVRTTSVAVYRRLDQLSAKSEDSVRNLSQETLVALVVVLLAGAALSSLVGNRIGRRVTEPLGSLERTAHRLAAGEYDARAPATGPSEVVQLAEAVNRMADENDRARAVEAMVVERLRALDSVKSDFVSNVSHELRTPLTSILGYLELLEDEMLDHGEQSEREMIAAAKRNVVRLGELINDLLALTRSEAQRTEFERLDLALLVRDIVTDLRVASSQQGVDVRLGLPGTPVPVLADGGQITRVVTNLVSNAVKFSQGDSEVVVTVLADGVDAILTVEDHGIGIPEAELDQLGSRFYRASNAVRLGITGTGLGLRIVQAIVENHSGNVDLRSTQGVGTTVWVRIPLADTPTTAANAHPGPSTTTEVVG